MPLRRFAECLTIEIMNHQFIHAAKQLIPQIVEQSLSLQPGTLLIIQETLTGAMLVKLEEIKIYLDDQGQATDLTQGNAIILGSRPLKKSEVKRIIEDEENLNFIKS